MVAAQQSVAAARVLVIDDQELLRELCSRVLERFGHTTLEARTGAQGIQMYEEKRPDAVLLDIGIPDMSGIAVLKEIRRIDPNARVAMLTGDRRSDAVRTAFTLGARDYIVKPFYSERLKQAMDRLLA